MNAFIDFTSLIFLVIAIAIFWRLRSVLGTRTGTEKQRPDPLAPRPGAETPQPASQGDNVITLPRSPRAENEVQATQARIDEVAEPGSATNGALKSIASADRGFDVDSFLAGARAAYEMIVTAFASGDRNSLATLLSREVFDGFARAIGEREQRGETMDFTFVGIDKADIVSAALTDGTAEVTVRFVSQLVSVTRSRDGAVIEGDASKVTSVTDRWTFARDIRSADPNWKLVATETEE